MDRSSVVPDAAGLKALAHPHRLEMLGHLRAEGPATATTLAHRLAINTGAASYHLRQLAQHGFIVEDLERGNARDRWWRAAHASTRMEGAEADPDAADAYLQTVALLYGERLNRAARERPFLGEEWAGAHTMSDWLLRITPATATRVLEAIEAIVEEVEDEPAGRTYAVMVSGFPMPTPAQGPDE